MASNDYVAADALARANPASPLAMSIHASIADQLAEFRLAQEVLEGAERFGRDMAAADGLEPEELIGLLADNPIRRLGCAGLDGALDADALRSLALVRWRRAVETFPHDAGLARAYARSLARHLDYVGAAEVLSRYCALVPDDGQLEAELYSLWVSAGQHSLLARHAERLQRQAVQSPAFAAAWIHYAQSLGAAAYAAATEQMAAIFPDDRTVIFHKARTIVAREDAAGFAEVGQHLLAITGLIPSTCATLFRLAAPWLETREALALVDRMSAVFPADVSCLSINLLQAVRLQGGPLLQRLKRAVGEIPASFDNGVAMRQIATRLARMGMHAAVADVAPSCRLARAATLLRGPHAELCRKLTPRGDDAPPDSGRADGRAEARAGAVLTECFPLSFAQPSMITPVERGDVDALIGRARLEMAFDPTSARGVLVYSTHMPGDSLVMACCAASGRKVTTLLGVAAALHQPAVICAHLSVQPECLLRQEATRRALPHRLLRALAEGHIVHLTADYGADAAQTALSPWRRVPKAHPTSIGLLAAAAGAKLLYGRAVMRDGGLAVVFTPIAADDLPASLSLRAKALVLTRRIAAAVRLAAAEEGGAMPSSFVRHEGSPIGRPLTPVGVYLAAHPGAARSILTAALPGATGAPEATAFRDDDAQLSFADVSDRARRVAALVMHLQQAKATHFDRKRIEDQHRVAILLAPGATMLAIVLGCLAAGSLFCCLSPSGPEQRLAGILKTFAPDIIIANPEGAEAVHGAFADAGNVFVIADERRFDAVQDLTASFEPARALPPFDRDAPALVVYTSGSTGEPKGVVLSQRHLLDDLGNVHVTLDLRADDVVTYVGSWYQVALLNVLAVLRAGACLRQPAPAALRYPGAFVAMLAQDHITVFSATTSFLQSLLRFGGLGTADLPRLRLIEFWGERTPPELVAALLRVVPTGSLYTSYGASESRYITGRFFSEPLSADAVHCPIGSPYPWVGIALLDDDGAVQGDRGQPGQLQVTSENVMLGYWSDVRSRTAAELAARPLTIVIPDIVLRAGDEDLAVLGRSDSIVKIAGHRISLAEIESAAATAPDIARALAVAGKNAAGQAEIWLALETSRTDIDAITDHLRSVLPDRAVPRKILCWATLPLLPGGKADRRAIYAALEAAER